MFGGSLAVCSVMSVGCGVCLVGHVVFVNYRAQQCDLNPDLLRVLEDGYVSKCCEAGCGVVLRAPCFSDVI